MSNINSDNPFYVSYRFARNWVIMFVFLFTIPIMALYIYSHFIILFFSIIAICYILFFYLIMGFKFYSEHFEMVFPLRFWPFFKETKIVVPYKDIDKIKIIAYRGNPPLRFRLLRYTKYQFFKWFFYEMPMGFLDSTLDYKNFLTEMKKRGVSIEIITFNDDYRKKLQPD